MLKTFCAVAVAACVLVACTTNAKPSSPGLSAATRAWPEPFVDSSLKSSIERRGGELALAGKARTEKSLSTELDKASCSASLPAQNTRQLDMPSLFMTAAPGVLVVAKIQHCEDCGRWHTRGGATAFAITADGVCATNYHVLDADDAEDDEPMIVVVATAWGEVFPISEVLAASKKDDVSIFRADVGDTRLDALPLRAAAPVGAPIAVLSHPAGHYYSFYPGHLTRRVWRYRGMNGDQRELAPEDDEHDDPQADISRLAHTIEISADYGVGSSGGPVLDLSGNVVGMVANTEALFAQPRSRRGLQMNFHHCVPAESILALIQQPSP